jgi:hypothetical protein
MMRWEQVARAEAYLTEAYRTAAAAFEAYRSEQNEAALNAATQILCTALQRLSGDSEFWSALPDLDSEYAAHRADIDKLLSNVGAAFRQEYAILQAALHDPRAASQLTSDAAGAVEEVHRRVAAGGPVGFHVATLQRSSENLRDTICNSGAEAPEARTFWAFRRAKRALRFLGGATIVAANAATMTVPGAIFVPTAVAAAVTSVLYGFEHMAKATQREG